MRKRRGFFGCRSKRRQIDFAVQMKQEYPDVFEKMTFHKKDKMTAMCEHLYSSFKDWNKTVAEMFKFYK